MPKDGERANATPVFSKSQKEKPGNYKLVTLTFISVKVMEQLILETISRHIKDKKTFRSSFHGFTKG